MADDMTVDDPSVDPSIDDGAGEPVVAEPSEYTPYAFGSTVFAGGAGNKITRIEAANTHTCYLRGIRGSLRGTNDVWQDRINTWVKLEIDAAGWWVAKTNPGYGAEVYADISCVRATYKRKFLFRHGSNLSTSANYLPNEDATSMTRCFLTGIEARGSAMHFRLWDEHLPGVKVSTDTGQWAVGTWFADNGDENRNGSAYAVCFEDSGTFSGLGYIENGSAKIHDGSTADWACGATGIFGIMKTGGEDAGARVHKVNDRWWATATANRGLLMRCYN